MGGRRHRELLRTPRRRVDHALVQTGLRRHPAPQAEPAEAEPAEAERSVAEGQEAKRGSQGLSPLLGEAQPGRRAEAAGEVPAPARAVAAGDRPGPDGDELQVPLLSLAGKLVAVRWQTAKTTGNMAGEPSGTVVCLCP